MGGGGWMEAVRREAGREGWWWLRDWKEREVVREGGSGEEGEEF